MLLTECFTLDDFFEKQNKKNTEICWSFDQQTETLYFGIDKSTQWLLSWIIIF